MRYEFLERNLIITRRAKKKWNVREIMTSNSKENGKYFCAECEFSWDKSFVPWCMSNCFDEFTE